jgi:hypothetical protein
MAEKIIQITNHSALVDVVCGFAGRVTNKFTYPSALVGVVCGFARRVTNKFTYPLFIPFSIGDNHEVYDHQKLFKHN